MVPGSELFPDPAWVAPHVQDCDDLSEPGLIAIVNREREPTGQCSMISAMDRVLSAKQPQPANIGNQRVPKVSSDTRFDSVVELNSVLKIGGGL